MHLVTGREELQQERVIRQVLPLRHRRREQRSNASVRPPPSIASITSLTPALVGHSPLFRTRNLKREPGGVVDRTASGNVATTGRTENAAGSEIADGNKGLSHRARGAVAREEGMPEGALAGGGLVVRRRASRREGPREREKERAAAEAVGQVRRHRIASLRCFGRWHGKGTCAVLGRVRHVTILYNQYNTRQRGVARGGEGRGGEGRCRLPKFVARRK